MACDPNLSIAPTYLGKYKSIQGCQTLGHSGYWGTRPSLLAAAKCCGRSGPGGVPSPVPSPRAVLGLNGGAVTHLLIIEVSLVQVVINNCIYYGCRPAMVTKCL